MMIAAEQPSDLVQIVTILTPVLILAVNAFIIFKQGQARDEQKAMRAEQREMKSEQSKMADHVNGNVTALMAAKDEITKLAAEAARYLGNVEGAANKKEEIRVDDLQRAVAVPSAASVPAQEPVPVTVIANEPVPVKLQK